MRLPWGALGRRAAPVVPAGTATWLLLVNDVEPRAVLVHVAYWLLVVLGPGLLVSRLVLGRSPLLVAELGAAGVTGLLLVLLGWAVGLAAGLGSGLRWWPLVVYALFAALPRLRRHWRPGGHREHLGPWVAWALALSLTAVLARWEYTFRQVEPLRGATQWPVDVYWHLGIVELLTRQLRPEDSQVSGQALAYHWFAHADMAATSLATGLDPALVVTRLWALPLIALTFAALLAVLREVGTLGPPAAAVAAAVIGVPAGLEVVGWLDVPWDAVFAPLSPSQTYSYPFLLLLLALVVRYLRAGGVRTLAPVALLLVLSPGVKASTLPIVVSGLVLATVVAVVLRGPWRRPATLAGLGVVAMLAGTLAIGAGGAAGSTVQVFAVLRRLPPYYEAVGLTPQQATFSGGLLPPGLEVPGAWSVLLLLLLATVLKVAWVAPGLALLRGRGPRVDTVAWFLFGGGLAGWLLMMVVDQSGLSQVYFVSTGSVLWAVLAGWGCVVLVDRAKAVRGRVATTRRLLAGAVVGAVAVLAVAAWGAAVAERVLPADTAPPPLDRTTVDGAIAALSSAVLPAAGLVLLGMGWVALAWRRRPVAVLRAVVVSSAVLAGSMTLNPWISLPSLPPPPPTTWAVSPSELASARWVGRHAGPHDVVATNVHCLFSQGGATCDARGFWVSALTRRRTFVGAWAYLDQTRAMGTAGGRPNIHQPFHDTARFALNEALFRDPTPEVVDALVARGVRYAFADRRRGPVSPRLADVAVLVHRDRDVDVYRLPVREGRR